MFQEFHHIQTALVKVSSDLVSAVNKENLEVAYLLTLSMNSLTVEE